MRHRRCPTVIPPRPGLLVAACLLLLPPGFTAAAGHWPQFRGPTGMGHADEKNLPVRWGGDKAENVLWKAELPPSTNPFSSPIVWGERVFVTTTRDEDPRDHRVLCFQLSDGKKLWETTIEPGPWKDGRNNGYPTPAADGDRVYVAFGTAVVAALDFDGKVVWRHELKNHLFDVAMGSSPILAGDAVVLLCDQNSGQSTLIAFDTKSGQVKWERPRPDMDFAHSTPVPATVGGKPQLLLSVSKGLQGVDPADGKVIWWCSNFGDTSSPVYSAAAGLVYADGGRGGPGVAVDIDPPVVGDVTRTNLKWKAEDLTEALGSPIIVGDYLYRLVGGEELRCYQLATGGEVYAEHLPGASTWASPVATPDGHVYFATGGKSYVVKAGPKFEVVATSDLGDPNHASPAVAGGRLVIKGQKFLWCIGEE